MKNILLNSKQQEAIDHIEGPLLVLAGAGSGKTSVVTMKIAKLIQIGVDPSSILAVTFTNKAANEMSQRIQNITSKNVLASTFHSLGARILRESIHHLGYTNNFSIYDEEDASKLLDECISSLNIKEDRSFSKKLRYKISNLKNEYIDLDNPNAFSILTKTELDIFRLYQNKLKSCNSLDFDDLLFLPIKLFSTNNEILSFYQKRWSFILVDEYQDTNFVQYLLMKMLSQKHQNICVVGDPDQSIYSFRGAKYQNILNFDKDFQDAKIVKLEKNYRSTPTILNAANILIKNNKNRFEKNLFSEIPDANKITLFKAENEQLEASFVVQKILELKKQNLELQDIAIFYRTNFQSRVFEDILLSQNIPYIIYGGISFYQRKEVKDILAFLKLIVSDSDFLAFYRTINIFSKGFGKTTMNKLFFLSEKNQVPILKLLKELLDYPKEDLKLSSTQKNNIQAYLANIYELRDLYSKNQDIEELIVQIISKMHFLEYLKQDPDSYENRKENIDEFITKAILWQEDNQKSLPTFLQELTLSTEKNKNSDEFSLKLMTLHNSKGLEFEAVFIVGLEEDLFPHVNSKNSNDEIEEERRLFYVGMTRAKKYLFITHSQNRFLWGSVKYSIPSRFLKELDKRYTTLVYEDEDEKNDEKIDNNEFESSSKVEFIDKKSFQIDENKKYFIGQKVYHNTFKEGIVQKIYQTSLGDTLDILFTRDNSTRSIVEKYAKLKIL